MKGGAPLALAGLLLLVMGLRGTYKDAWKAITGAYKGTAETNTVTGTKAESDTRDQHPASGGNPRGWGSPRHAPIGYPGSGIVPPQ